MSGLHRNYKLGPDTVLVSATIKGGQVLEADPSNIGFVRAASAGSTTFLGVATDDAEPGATNPTSPLNIAWPTAQVGVEYGPADVDVTYASSAKFGALLVCAAAGQVIPAGAASDPAVNTTLAAGASAGATTISCTATVAATTTITIGTGGTQETRTTTAVSGAGPYTVTVPALTYAHLSGETVVSTLTAAGTAAAVGNIVGRCTSPLGVDAGSVGRMRLSAV